MKPHTDTEKRIILWMYQQLAENAQSIDVITESRTRFGIDTRTAEYLCDKALEVFEVLEWLEDLTEGSN